MTDHDPTYVAELAAQLEKASQFRIPCPGHPYGRHADLTVERRHDGFTDTWAITRDQVDVWTGNKWEHRTDLHRHEVYRYTRQDALAEASRIAPLETEAFRIQIQRLRAERRQEAGDASG